MNSLTVSAVSFDAAGTLIHLAEPVGTTYSRVAAEHGIEATAASLNSSFGRVWERTPAPFSPGIRGDLPDEKNWWRRLVEEVFRECGANWSDTAQFDHFFESLYLHFESPGVWTIDRETRRAVTRVAAAFPCIVLSNFDARLRRILADLDLLEHFDEVVLSSEQRASKPNPAIFRAAAETLGLPSGEILHVGDDPTCDWKGSTEAGFQCFRVENGPKSLSRLLQQLSLA